MSSDDAVHETDCHSHLPLEGRRLTFTGYDEGVEAHRSRSRSRSASAGAPRSLAAYQQLAHVLGAVVHPQLRRDTNVVIAWRGLTAKRLVAARHRIPVVLPQWLEMEGQMAMEACIVPWLYGYRISSTQLSREEEAALETIIQRNGGQFCRQLTMDCDALLISRATRRALHAVNADARTMHVACADEESSSWRRSGQEPDIISEKMRFAWANEVPVMVIDRFLSMAKLPEDGVVSAVEEVSQRCDFSAIAQVCRITPAMVVGEVGSSINNAAAPCEDAELSTGYVHGSAAPSAVSHAEPSSLHDASAYPGCLVRETDEVLHSVDADGLTLPTVHGMNEVRDDDDDDDTKVVAHAHDDEEDSMPFIHESHPLTVAVLGCTTAEWEMAARACCMCGFVLLPFPSSSTDVVLLGSELVSATTTSASHQRRARSASPTTLRQRAVAKELGVPAHQNTFMRKHCSMELAQRLERLHGIHLHRIATLDWLHDCRQMMSVVETNASTMAESADGQRRALRQLRKYNIVPIAAAPANTTKAPLGPPATTPSSSSSSRVYAPVHPRAVAKQAARALPLAAARPTAKVVAEVVEESEEVLYQRDRQAATAMLNVLLNLLRGDCANNNNNTENTAVGSEEDLHISSVLAPCTWCFMESQFSRCAMAITRGLIHAGGGHILKYCANEWKTMLRSLKSRKGDDSSPTTTSTSTTTTTTTTTTSTTTSMDSATRKHLETVRRNLIWHKRRAAATTEVVPGSPTSTMMGSPLAEEGSVWESANFMMNSDASHNAMTCSSWAAVSTASMEDASLTMGMSSTDVATGGGGSPRIAHAPPPALYVLPHFYQMEKPANNEPSSPRGGGAVAASSSSSASLTLHHGALRHLPHVTIDYLLSSLAVRQLLHPSACFFFHRPLTTSPCAGTPKVPTSDAHAQPSKWQWKMRYAKSDCVGINICVVWRTSSSHTEEKEEHTRSSSCTTMCASDATTAALIRALRCSLESIVLHLGGSMGEVFRPNAITHVLVVDVATIAASRLADTNTAHACSGGVYSNPDAILTGWQEEMRGELAVVSLDWLADSAQCGYFLDEGAESYRWHDAELAAASASEAHSLSTPPRHVRPSPSPARRDGTSLTNIFNFSTPGATPVAPRAHSSSITKQSPGRSLRETCGLLATTTTTPRQLSCGREAESLRRSSSVGAFTPIQRKRVRSPLAQSTSTPPNHRAPTSRMDDEAATAPIAARVAQHSAAMHRIDSPDADRAVVVPASFMDARVSNEDEVPQERWASKRRSLDLLGYRDSTLMEVEEVVVMHGDRPNHDDDPSTAEEVREHTRRGAVARPCLSPVPARPPSIDVDAELSQTLAAPPAALRRMTKSQHPPRLLRIASTTPPPQSSVMNAPPSSTSISPGRSCASPTRLCFYVLHDCPGGSDLIQRWMRCTRTMGNDDDDDDDEKRVLAVVDDVMDADVVVAHEMIPRASVLLAIAHGVWLVRPSWLMQLVEVMEQRVQKHHQKSGPVLLALRDEARRWLPAHEWCVAALPPAASTHSRALAAQCLPRRREWELHHRRIFDGMAVLLLLPANVDEVSEDVAAENDERTWMLASVRRIIRAGGGVLCSEARIQPCVANVGEGGHDSMTYVVETTHMNPPWSCATTPSTSAKMSANVVWNALRLFEDLVRVIVGTIMFHRRHDGWAPTDAPYAVKELLVLVDPKLLTTLVAMGEKEGGRPSKASRRRGGATHEGTLSMSEWFRKGFLSPTHSYKDRLRYVLKRASRRTTASPSPTPHTNVYEHAAHGPVLELKQSVRTHQQHNVGMQGEEWRKLEEKLRSARGLWMSRDDVGATLTFTQLRRVSVRPMTWLMEAIEQLESADDAPSSSLLVQMNMADDEE